MISHNKSGDSTGLYQLIPKKSPLLLQWNLKGTIDKLKSLLKENWECNGLGETVGFSFQNVFIQQTMFIKKKRWKEA